MLLIFHFFTFLFMKVRFTFLLLKLLFTFLLFYFFIFKTISFAVRSDGLSSPIFRHTSS